MRINQAKDDAAGLSVSTRMEAQIREHNQAIRNVNDGISMVQVAEGGMQESINIMQRMRELAVQAANDTYNSGDRADMEAELDQLKAHLNSIASDTEFNGQKLLDGSFTGKKIQVGKNESVSLDISQSLATTALPDISDEFEINTTTTGEQDGPSVVGLNNGGFVAIWSAGGGQDGSSNGVFGQIYDSNSDKVGSEFLINTVTNDSQSQPSNRGVASLSDGGFMVTWESYRQRGVASPVADVYGQRYDSNGNTVGGELEINTTGTNYQGGSSVTGLNNGGFAVTWGSRDQDGSGDGVYGQIYDSSSNAVGGEFLVNTEINDAQNSPSITSLSNGNFVIAWNSNNQDGSGSGVYGQMFDSNGTASGSEFLVNTTTNDSQSNADIAGLADGGFVVSWKSNNQDGSGTGIYGQMFDSNGTASGSEFLVNTTTSGDQKFNSVAALTGGGYVFSWVSVDDNKLFSQKYNSDGSKNGVEFSVGTQASSTAYDFTSSSGLESGGYVTTWTAQGTSGTNDIFGMVLGETLDDISLLTQTLAETAISVIDSSIDKVSDQQASVGAFQNRLESVSNNLMNAMENTSQARSRIMDADIAQETANLTTASILQQAGVAILAQANQQPQIALQLLG